MGSLRQIIIIHTGKGLSDMVISGPKSTTIEVHDYFPAFYFERGWVGRRLDVIAALEMQAADPDRQFSKVDG